MRRLTARNLGLRVNELVVPGMPSWHRVEAGIPGGGMAVVEFGGIAAGSGLVTGPRLSVVVPCYNESEGLHEMHRRVSAVAAREVAGDYELILVNDGSRDDTWAKILELVNRDPHVVGVALSRNHGHQLALSAGLTLCRGARILVIDADLQDPPELLPDMMALMEPGGRGRLRPARQPRRRDLVQAHDRRPVLPAAGAARGDRHPAGQRRFPPDQPPRA